jgi:hypothetical protein
MTHTYRHPRILLFSACFAVASISGVVSYILNTSRDEPVHRAAPTESGAYLPCTSCAAEAVISDTDSLAAKRLQERLMSENGVAPGIAVLDHALKEKARFVRQSITMHVTDPSDPEAPAAQWTVDFAKHPELITLRSTWATASYGIDRDLFAEYLAEGTFGDAGRMQSVIVTEAAPDGKNVLRAPNAQVARSGYDYDTDDLAVTFEKALRNGSSNIDLHLPYKKGTVQVSINGELRQLDLLSTGRSDFSNSPEERVWNVHKAVEERVNNIVVPKGGTFSFVDALDAPVTIQKGWKEGLGLFGGGAALTPGAGICQAATTVYRAALLAGLPITYKRNHSMFVDHYEPFGVGLDATVFPGVHDMTFKNDTADILLIQAYTVGDDVYVNVYGADDGRTVVMDGPYFNTTPHRAKELRPLDYDEIGWVQTVTYPDGTQKVKPIVSTYYKGFARSVKEKYAGTPGIVLLSLPGAVPQQTVASALP